MIRFESGESTKFQELQPTIASTTSAATENDAFIIINDSTDQEFTRDHFPSQSMTETIQARVWMIVFAVIKYVLIFLAVFVFPFRERLLETARTLQTRQKALGKTQYHRI